VTVNRSAILPDDRYIEHIKKSNTYTIIFKYSHIKKCIYGKSYLLICRCIYILKFKSFVYYKHIKIKNIEYYKFVFKFLFSEQFFRN